MWQDRVALWLREMWARGKQTSPDELEALAHCVHFEVLKAGEMLASEGLIGYAMVIVVEGSVEGTSSMGKGTVVLGPGDSFGQSASQSHAFDQPHSRAGGWSRVSAVVLLTQRCERRRLCCVVAVWCQATRCCARARRCGSAP